MTRRRWATWSPRYRTATRRTGTVVRYRSWSGATSGGRAISAEGRHVSVNGWAPSVFPGEHWEAAEHPEQDGWSMEKLAEARGIARGAGSTALLVIHRGRMVLEYGDTGRRTIVASVRKSLLSALYGIHVAAGTIDLSTTLGELGIDDNEPSLTPEEKQA